MSSPFSRSSLLPLLPPTTGRAGALSTTRLPLALIVGLSLLDLAVTVFFMRTVGMYEANPLVHLLTQCSFPVLALCLFKVTTVGFCTGLLYALWRHRCARLAAWLLVGVLAWVAARWLAYGAIAADWGFRVVGQDPTWVRLH